MALKLCILPDEGRFIPNVARPDAVMQLPPFVYGDQMPLELSAYRRSVNDPSRFDAIDLSAYDIELAIGDPNARPQLGFFTLTFTSGTTAAIPVTATAAEFEALLGDSGITIEGVPGDYVLTYTTNGARSVPTIAFTGATNVTADVVELDNGSATTPAQWRILLQQAAPAGVIAADWSEGSTTPASSVSGSGKIWRIIPDAGASNGFYTLTANGTTTEPISIFASAFDVQNALGLANATCGVQYDVRGGFYVVFTLSTTLTIDDSSLVIAPFQTATINLDTYGIRELLDGVNWVSAEMSIELSQADEATTCAFTGVILKMPIATPAASTVPIYQRTAFVPLTGYTGGAQTDLDGQATANGAIATGSIAFTTVSSIFGTWQLQAGTSATDVNGGIVRPVDYNASTNARVWIRIA